MQIFISYASEDQAGASKVYRQLQAVGLDVWLDKHSLLPGQDWNVEIERAIIESDLILILLSKHSITKRGYVQKEIRDCLEYSKMIPEDDLYIIPAKLEDCELPRSLSKYQCVNLQKRDGIVRLVQSISLAAKRNDFELFTLNSLGTQKVVFDLFRAIMSRAVDWNALSLNEFTKSFLPLAQLFLLSELEYDDDDNELTREQIYEEYSTSLKVDEPDKLLALFQKLRAVSEIEKNRYRPTASFSYVPDIAASIQRIRSEKEMKINPLSTTIENCVENRAIGEELGKLLALEYKNQFPLSQQALENISQIKSEAEIPTYCHFTEERFQHVDSFWGKRNDYDHIYFRFVKGDDLFKFSVNKDSESFQLNETSISVRLDGKDRKFLLDDLESIYLVLEGYPKHFLFFPNITMKDDVPELIVKKY